MAKRAMEDWLSLRCPSCKSVLRIRTVYAHLRGRCPECGHRIAAPRPRKAAPAAQRAEDKGGLVPIEEEWPEPPCVVSFDEDDTSVADAPKPGAERPTGPGAYGLQEAEQVPPPALPPDLDDSGAPAAEPGAPIIYRLSHAERHPLRAPPPPALPLIQGIYLFPWRPENLMNWFFLSIEFILLAGLACLVREFLGQYESGSLLAGFLPPLIAVISLVALFIGCYAVISFTTILEETAAGTDRFPKAEWTVWEGFTRLAFLSAVLAISVLPGAFLRHWIRESEFTWMTPFVFGAFLFPIFLLSMLSANSLWRVLDAKVLGPLLRRPQALFALYVPSLLLLIPSLWLGYVTIWKMRAYLAPVAGPIWAAALLIYGRLLGRIGWYVSLREDKKKKKKKPPPVEPHDEETVEE